MLLALQLHLAKNRAPLSGEERFFLGLLWHERNIYIKLNPAILHTILMNEVMREY